MAQLGNVGFAAGGLLTKSKNYEYGGYTRTKEDFPEGSYATEDEGTSTGELTPGIGKENRDRGNPHIGEEAIRGNPRGALPTKPWTDLGKGLGTRLMELLGLDEKEFRNSLKGMPIIGRAASQWNRG